MKKACSRNPMDLKLAAGARRMTDSMHIAISRYLAAGGDVKIGRAHV